MRGCGNRGGDRFPEDRLARTEVRRELPAQNDLPVEGGSNLLNITALVFCIFKKKNTSTPFVSPNTEKIFKMLSDDL